MRIVFLCVQLNLTHCWSIYQGIFVLIVQNFIFGIGLASSDNHSNGLSL